MWYYWAIGIFIILFLLWLRKIFRNVRNALAMVGVGNPFRRKKKLENESP